MEIITLRIPLIPSLDIRFKTFNELSLHKKKKKKKKILDYTSLKMATPSVLKEKKNALWNTFEYS